MARWRDIKQGRVKQPSSSSQTPLFIPASIPDRLKAFLTDTFMITMPILYIVIYLVMGSREAFKEHMGEGWLIIISVHYLITIAFWLKSGQTPGLKAYGLKLVKWHNPEEKVTFFRATVRYFAMPISIISIIGLFIAFFHKDRATFHDLVSLSRIVKIEDI
ncbi:RDD family protein [Nitratiruptor sp. YY09-18]|uniref:RDD family protein n=1 Tax=Nitratiruptor sp. YY09-18 TaxID=2724901 RepID=UPI0019154323|nr:RDD family protein [Nitratiruptor sp. YY09-18]BCD68920.1 hypothetical protein NitYY0918_C1843 [Nitratiruptor sp. YY09-18]